MSFQVSPRTIAALKPAKLRAEVAGDWQDVPVPKNGQRWAMVAETLQTLSATKIQVLSEDGTLVRALDIARPEVRPQQPEQPEGNDATAAAEGIAALILQAQSLALRQHNESLKTLSELLKSVVADNIKATQSMGTHLGTMAKTVGELAAEVRQLAGALTETAADAAESKIDAAESAASAMVAEGREEGRSETMNKIVETLGPAVGEAIAKRLA